MILAALNRGWSDETPNELEDYDSDDTILIEAKLNILERQNRVEEYLKFAIEHRRRVKEQLKRMGGIEYSKVNLSYLDKIDGIFERAFADES